jgi:hypothetical protein
VFAVRAAVLLLHFPPGPKATDVLARTRPLPGIRRSPEVAEEWGLEPQKTFRTTSFQVR